MKTHKAELILIQIQALQEATPDNTSNMLTLVNEIVRDAKQLAEEVLKSDDKVA